MAGIYGVLIVTATIPDFLIICALCKRNELSTPPEKATTKDFSSFSIELSFSDFVSGISKILLIYTYINITYI